MPGQMKDKRPTLIALYRNLTELGRDPNGVTKDVLVDRKLRFPEQLKDKFYKAILQKCKDFDQEDGNLFYSKKDYTNFPYYKNNQYVKKYIEDYPEFNGNPVALILYLGEGKIKGTKPIGKSVFYYASLIIGFYGESGLPIEAQKCAIEVFTPIEKGEEYWLNTFTKALSKFDAKKFKGKKILINECKDSVKTTATASAERKFRFKDGSVITASTAEEAKAKHKVTAADKKAQDASKVKDSIKKVLGSLGLSYTEDNWGDFSVKTIFGKVKIDFDEYRNNIKVRWGNIFSKIYGEDDDVFYSLKISDSNSASKIKEMLEDILKLAELDKKVNKKYAFSAPSWL